MNNDEYVKHNLVKFDLFYEKVQKEGCDLLKQLMDEAWYKEVRPLIQAPRFNANQTYHLICNPYDWLADGAFCENAWDIVNRSIPILIDRTKKKDVLRHKLDSIKRGEFYQTLDTIFELSVLCNFSDIIVDIDRKIKVGSGSNVDAIIRLTDREVLLESTRINKDLVDPNARTGTMSVDKMMGQVIRKMKDKAGKDIQLALAQCPSILVICPPTRGTIQDTIRWALESKISLFDKVGIVISSDNHNFKGCKWYINTQANYPFADEEIKQLKNILWQTDPVVIENNTAINL